MIITPVKCLECLGNMWPKIRTEKVSSHEYIGHLELVCKSCGYVIEMESEKNGKGKI